MKIKHTLKHNVKGEAPFTGAILESTTEGKKIRYAKPKLIIEEIISFGNEGVMFTGDWCRRGKQFVELIKEIEKYPQLKVMIYTDLTIEDFMFEMGIVFWNSTSPKKVKRKNITGNDKEMVKMIGSTVLDHYLTNEVTDRYYVMAKFEDGTRVYQVARSENEEIVEEVLN